MRTKERSGDVARESVRRIAFGSQVKAFECTLVPVQQSECYNKGKWYLIKFR